MRFVIRGSLKFPKEEVAKTVFKAIYPDVVRDEVKNVSMGLSLIDKNIEFEVCSDSYAKFRGAATSLLRLIRLTVELIEEVRV